MPRKHWWSFVFILLALATTALIFLDYDKNKGVPLKYIFINQTSDHRFDDSIRITILANQRRANVQNAVIIVESLPSGESIESWAAKLFKRFHMGEASNGKGILYLFLPKEKRLKIEVGYALEGILPDVTVAALEEAAKSFTYADRLHDFWADLINTINVVVHNHQASIPSDYYFSDWKYQSGGAGVSRGTYEVSAKQLEKEFTALTKGEARFNPGKSAQSTLDLYLTSLAEGIGDVNLPLLSTGSRLYRQHSPMNRALLKRMWRMYQDASPYQFAGGSSSALAWFKPKNPVLPIFLYKKENGEWVVHEPYSFSIYNRFEDSMSIFQTQPIVPEAKIFSQLNLGKPIYWGAPKYRPQPLEGDAFFDNLEVLEKKANAVDADSIFRLADVYLFEMWNYEKALALYEQALKIKPNETKYLWRILSPYIYSGKGQEFVLAYGRLAALLPREKEIRRNYEFYKKTHEFKDTEWVTKL